MPGTRAIDLLRDPLGAPLQARYRKGFEYSDCQADDARLVVLNARDAADRGANIRTRTRCLRAERGAEWRLVFETGGLQDVATARVLINATGPWAGIFNETVLQQPRSAGLRLDKGSHIVVRRMFAHDRGYIFQTRDGRVVFALPFTRDFTLVGTTDLSFSGDPATRRADGGRSRLSLRRRERTLPHRDRAGGCAMVVRRRACALRRRGRQAGQ